MTDKPVRTPGPDHPITIEPDPARITVTHHGVTIADTTNALLLREARYPAVRYIPRADVDMARLTRTDHATYCPYKGDCSYYSLPGDEPAAVNAIWSYEAPYDAVAEIAGHLAFYPDRVEIREG